MEIFKNKEDCCGCTACMTVCPKKAITMKADKKGFLYPEIDNEKCIECGLCVKSCAFQNGYDKSRNLEKPSVYAVKHKNEEERKTSRSGGMFVAVADWILQNNGIVYGAGYGDKFYAMHKRAENKTEMFEFKGSKYVQSDMNTVFSQVISDLKADRYVLFSGTPCQTAGLYSALRNVSTEKLFVCDIVCHGAPSPYIWKDYLEYSEKKYKSEITKVDFRDKAYGWNTHIESLGFKNGKNISSDLYTHFFYKHIMFRPSCSTCKYTNTTRPSDITLADFWGIDKAVENFNDNKGVSLVFLNTEKAEKLFKEINKNLHYESSKLEDCMQHNLKKPSIFSEQTDLFWKDYCQNGFEFVVNKYDTRNLKQKIKLMIRKCMKSTGLK